MAGIWLAVTQQHYQNQNVVPKLPSQRTEEIIEWESNMVIHMQKSSAKLLKHCCRCYILHSLNLSQDTNCSEIFNSFPQSLQANASRVPRSGHDHFQIIFSSSFINHPTSRHYKVWCWHHHNKTIYAMYHNNTVTCLCNHCSMEMQQCVEQHVTITYTHIFHRLISLSWQQYVE
jgi:hypothetical protein